MFYRREKLLMEWLWLVLKLFFSGRFVASKETATEGMILSVFSMKCYKCPEEYKL